jgi:glutamate-ammonia-ligase adenylyltransferase
VEHRLQMVNDAQTHDDARHAEGVARIAAFCGQTEAASAAAFWTGCRTDRLTEGFFAPAAEDGPELCRHRARDRRGLGKLSRAALRPGAGDLPPAAPGGF